MNLRATLPFVRRHPDLVLLGLIGINRGSAFFQVEVKLRERAWAPPLGVSGYVGIRILELQGLAL